MALSKVFRQEIEPNEADVVLLPIVWSSVEGTDEKVFEQLLNCTNEIELFHEFYGYQPRCKIACDVNIEPFNWFKSVRNTDRDSKIGAQFFNDEYEKVKSFTAEKLSFWLEHKKLPILIAADRALEILFLDILSGPRSDLGFINFGEVQDQKLPLRNDLFSKALFIGFDNVTPQLLDSLKFDPKNVRYFSSRRIANSKIGGDSLAVIIKRLVSGLPEHVFYLMAKTNFPFMNWSIF